MHFSMAASLCGPAWTGSCAEACNAKAMAEIPADRARTSLLVVMGRLPPACDRRCRYGGANHDREPARIILSPGTMRLDPRGDATGFEPGVTGWIADMRREGQRTARAACLNGPYEPCAPPRLSSETIAVLRQTSWRSRRRT